MSCTDLWPIALSVFIIVSSPVLCKGKTNGRVIQTLEDEIGAENFTYYKLHRSGALRLELKSLLGDVDIYVSTEVQHPDYSNYDLKSETCGLDVIQIPSTMSRPVYIALFGHPNYLLSKYRLSTLEVEEPALDDYEILVDKYERYYYEEMEGYPEDSSDEKSSKNKEEIHSSNSVEDELPMWWKILLSVLEFGIEVIL
ncbi:UPF0669 protein [Biomphalaria glabrata]|uniref:UPF0669 protein v1g209471-like n=1 Tax=Biomphalaria glabrata TaxID=6526 RepID=A0A2C9LK43_BIOGL|nr:UPF0669 protein v1g209471-like [Biomphalaria glabrata]KAI8740788.1 hypothetical protein BgiMline_023878 [Biomphalaria glabrata]